MNEDNKQACLTLMAMKDESLTPQARYFLIRMMYFYGSSIVNTKSLKSDRRFGVSHSNINKAVFQLKRSEYLQLALETIEQPTKRGRPQVGFRVKTKWWDSWRSGSIESLNGLVRYAHLIDNFLFDVVERKLDLVGNNDSIFSVAGKKKADMGQRERSKFSSDMTELKENSLSPANRILLATLYLRADECGVVRGLGSADLLRLTGMGRERLDDQFDKLKRIGYLLERVAGLTGVHTLGQVKSVFYLNPIYQPMDGKYRSVVLTCNENEPSQFHGAMWSYFLFQKGHYIFLGKNKAVSDVNEIEKNFLSSQIYNDASCTYVYKLHMNQFKPHEQDLVRAFYNEDASSLSWMEDFNQFGLSQIFQDYGNNYLARYLQSKICEYASELLTLYRSDIANVPKALHQNIISRIANEIYPESLRTVKGRDDEKVILRVKAVGLLIYRMGFQVAFLHKSIVDWVFKEQYDTAVGSSTFSIIPVSPMKNSSRAIRWAVVISNSDSCFSHPVMSFEITKNPPFWHTTPVIKTSLDSFHPIKDFFAPNMVNES